MDATIQKLQAISDWQNRLIGTQQMQEAVLRWAVANKAALPPDLIPSIIAAMEAQLAIASANRPKVSA